MNLDLIHSDFPIWEVTDWLLPDIDYSELVTKDFDQSSKHYKSSNLRQETNIEITPAIKIEVKLISSSIKNGYPDNPRYKG